MPELSPTTRSAIIREVQTRGEHEATHYGLRVKITRSLMQIHGKPKKLITLAACVDRKWKSFPCATVFDACEQINALMDQKVVRKQVQREGLFPDV